MNLKKTALCVMYMAALFPAAFAPPVLYAQTGEPSGPVLEEEEFAGVPFETLDDIIVSADFGAFRDVRKIRLKHPVEKDFPAFKELPEPWAEKIREIVAYALRLLTILAIIAAGGFVLRRYFRYRKHQEAGLRRAATIRAADSPLPPEPESLLEQARLYHDQGAVRDAWAACFSAAIAAYTRDRGISFPRDATEYDCLLLVNPSGAAMEGLSPSAVSAPASVLSTIAEESGSPGAFAGLVSRWVNLAYRGRAPEEGAFDRALEFCQSLMAGPDPAAETGAPHHG